MRTGRSVKDGSSNFDEAVALPLIVQHIKLCQCLCSNGVRKAQRALLSAVWFSPARGARKNHGGAKHSEGESLRERKKKRLLSDWALLG